MGFVISRSITSAKDRYYLCLNYEYTGHVYAIHYISSTLNIMLFTIRLFMNTFIPQFLQLPLVRLMTKLEGREREAFLFCKHRCKMKDALNGLVMCQEEMFSEVSGS